MSDERQTGSVAILSEHLQNHSRPAGSLKRKLGYDVPISREWSATYPSPPMSNPPSPPRPSSPPTPSTSAPQQTATTSPEVLSATQTLPPHTASQQQSTAPPPFDVAATASADHIPTFGYVLPASGSFTTLSGGQSVFSVGPSAAPSAVPATSTPARAGRKSKAHVASACMNCKRAHLSCDTQRPCTRCVTTGKQDTCFDVPHKKRGRPRLREESEFKAEQVLPEQAGHAIMPMTPVRAAPSMARPIAKSRHQRTESLRSLRSQNSDGSSGSSLPTPGYPPILQAGRAYPALRPPSSGLSAAMVPTAFLDLDFNFIRANRPFRQIVARDQEVRGRQLQDVVAPSDGVDFLTLRGRLKGERETREPAHMPPMLQPGDDPIQGVMEDDVERLAAGFSDQTYTWTRATPGPQRETFPARVRLAKATAYFVVVTLPSFRPVEMLPPRPITSLPSPGFMIPLSRAPILPEQHIEQRFHTLPTPAPFGSQYPQGGVRRSADPYVPPGQTFQGRSYPSIQAQSPSQTFAPPAQQMQQSTTPRLQAAEPPMHITPSTSLTAAPRQHHPLAPAIQLPPLAAAAPSVPPPVSTMGLRDSAIAQQPASDDDEESPRKRRRMDISDVLR